MTVQTLPPPKATPTRQGMECRVFERFPCDLRTSCQPVAARSDKDLMWPATVRDISVGGVGLVLHRRFERGAGLAVEIPETASYPGDTLLARVVHVTTLGEKTWLLGCSFISHLSDDGLAALLHLAQNQQTPSPIKSLPADETTLERLAANETPCLEPRLGSKFLLTGLDFEGTTGKGRVGSIPVRRLYLSGSWPLPAGTILRMRPAAEARGLAQIQIRVLDCIQQGNRWKVRYAFADKPSAAWLALLGHQAG